MFYIDLQISEDMQNSKIAKIVFKDAKFSGAYATAVLLPWAVSRVQLRLLRLLRMQEVLANLTVPCFHWALCLVVLCHKCHNVQLVVLNQERLQSDVIEIIMQVVKMVVLLARDLVLKDCGSLVNW